jgi:predicted RNA binding protein YcfA (HicA-like mRNA interferase family)
MDVELSSREVERRLTAEGWVPRHGARHDVYKDPDGPGRIVVPRHRTLSVGGAREIAKKARWL